MTTEGETPKVVPFESWFASHQEYFKDYQFPEPLAMLLYQKLSQKIFDVGDFFTIDVSMDPDLIYTPKDEKTELEPGSNVFITDHCWQVKPQDIYAQWKQLPELRERLADYLSYTKAAEDLSIEEIIAKCDGKKLEIEQFDLPSIKELNIAERFPNLEVLSLLGNQISDSSEILGLVSGLKNLKALWLNSNPVAEVEGLEKSILDLCPKLEMYNSKFTENWSEWILLFFAHSTKPETVSYLNISGRGIKELKPEAFKRFRNLARLDISNNEVDISKIKEIIPSLGSITCDHPEQAPKNICFVNGVDEKEGVVSMNIPDRIWDHLQAVGEYWCLGDEIALAIHPTTGDPNFAQMPVRSPVDGETKYIFWPVQTIKPFDEVICDMFPLIPIGLEVDTETPKPLTPMKSLKSKFVSSVTKKRPLKIYLDIDVFRENIHSDKFQLVDTPEEADLRWFTFRNIEDFKEVYDNKILVDQIEGEENITSKDLLYETCTEYMGNVPWLPETYILTEPEQITRFMKRHEELVESNQSHAWVCKAFNTSRANYMIVSENVSEILRHASVGPRLAQRYMWNPLNIYGQKFDLRFIVLLKSVKPMELYAYKVFWPRFAPKQWCLDDFTDYERHFTVMNYRAPEKVTSKNWDDFEEEFNIENKDIKWSEMLDRCYKAMRDMFICGCQKMVPSPYTKSMFGIDMMITNDYQPVILECNFQPDCHRACNLCPTFVDDILEVMFTDQPVTNPRVVQIPLE